jgi:hypothetical protein
MPSPGASAPCPRGPCAGRRDRPRHRGGAHGGDQCRRRDRRRPADRRIDPDVRGAACRDPGRRAPCSAAHRRGSPAGPALRSACARRASRTASATAT